MKGNLWTSEGWILGEIRAESGRVVGVSGASADPRDNREPYVLPGFIDLHCHGGGGADVMDAGEAVHTIAATHARFGTTSFLATTMTSPPSDLQRVLAALGKVARGPRTAGGARLLGVHLEGPYISSQRLGAQPDNASQGSLRDIEPLLELAPVRVLTIAPEIAGHLELIAALTARGIRVQLGHSIATYEEGVDALRAGASSFTHLFNAMSPLHHRNPGLVGAALAHAEFAELIPDLLHVHPGAIRAALRAIPRLYAVTDSTAATGMPDGEYHLGSQAVTKCMGGVRLADGTLAGSTLTMDDALRNLVSLGIPIEDVSRRLSHYPAEYLGMVDRGHLARGAWADCVVLDRQLNVTATYVEGERVVPDAC